MSRILLLLTLLLWFVPAPVGAEKSTPLIFEIDKTLNQPKYVTAPLPEEFHKETKPTPQPKAPTPKTTRQVSARPVQSKTNRFVYGNCTYYVAEKVSIPWGGDANQWIPNAKRMGYTVNKSPRTGAVLVTSESRRGHVAYIESVSGEMVTISEWNYEGFAIRSTRTLDISNPIIKGIIHVNGI